MIIAPMIEVHDVEFFRRLRNKNRGVRPPHPIGAALKAIAAPPASVHDRSIAVGKYVAGRGVPLSCETRRSAGGPPPPSTIPLTDRSEPMPEIDPADVQFLYSSVVSPDLRGKLIHAVATRPRADQDTTFYVAWEESITPLSDAIAELVDREPAAMALFRLLYGPNGSPAKRALAATETVADGLAKIVAASRERRAAEGARQVRVIEEAMRRNGLVVTRTPAVAMRKMFSVSVSDDGIERYPDKQSVKVLIKSMIGQPDASVLLNWIDTLDRMPIHKAATERNGAACQALLRRIDKHGVTPAQAGVIRRALMGGL